MLCRLKHYPCRRFNRDPSPPAFAADEADCDPHAVDLDNLRFTLVELVDAATRLWRVVPSIRSMVELASGVMTSHPFPRTGKRPPVRIRSSVRIRLLRHFGQSTPGHPIIWPGGGAKCGSTLAGTSSACCGLGQSLIPRFSFAALVLSRVARRARHASNRNVDSPCQFSLATVLSARQVIRSDSPAGLAAAGRSSHVDRR
jgi:hypothetical protein